MKNLLINPKISINIKRKEVNDQIDHALINWLIKNSYSPIVISNKSLMLSKKKLYLFLKSLNIKGIILSGGNDVKKKVSSFKQVVYKPLSYYIVPPDRILYSSIMTQGEVGEKTANIEQAPCIFQEYIEKDFELRITVVGKKVFPIKIQSQQNNITKFDWRKDQINIDYEIFELPKGIQQKLLNLHQKFEIFFGAYDFIVDPNGEYYFLEVNPAGQWLWLEEILNLSISESIAEALIDNTKN